MLLSRSNLYRSLFCCMASCLTSWCSVRKSTEDVMVSRLFAASLTTCVAVSMAEQVDARPKADLEVSLVYLFGQLVHGDVARSTDQHLALQSCSAPALQMRQVPGSVEPDGIRLWPRLQFCLCNVSPERQTGPLRTCARGTLNEAERFL